MSKSKIATSNKNNSNQNQLQSVFGKKNYIILAIGIAVMAAGFLLMTGGKTTDPNVFNAAELYSPRRITFSPILILSGIVICALSIFYKDK
jgi:hypothetical protein